MKLALITGASAGIGAATAAELAGLGYSLLLVARRKERLSILQDQLQTSYPNLQVWTESLDITNHGAVVDFFKKYEPQLKSLELLLNNAGLAKGADKVQDGLWADWDVMIETNVKGLLSVTRQALPFLLANKKGHIVNIGSVAGRWIYPGGAVYCASKFAVRALTEGLRMDLLGKNIRVTNIEPGMVHTEFSRVRFSDQTKADQVYAGMKPLTAADIAETIAWVVSRPSHVNIQELVIYPTDQASVRDVSRTE